jgi:hypothetical protein
MFAMLRLNLFKPEELQKEYIFDIKDVGLVPETEMNEATLRL